MLAFEIDFPDVLSDYTDAEKLDTAEEADDGGSARPACNGITGE